MVPFAAVMLGVRPDLADPSRAVAGRRGAAAGWAWRGLRLLRAGHLVLPAPRPGGRDEPVGHRPRRGGGRHARCRSRFRCWQPRRRRDRPAARADVLLLAGTAWSVWSLRFLGRNVSVLAQARDVVDRGPYRWVRHPLYAGEIVSCARSRDRCRDQPRQSASGWPSVPCRPIARCVRSRCCCGRCPGTAGIAPAPRRSCRGSSRSCSAAQSEDDAGAAAAARGSRTRRR